MAISGTASETIRPINNNELMVIPPLSVSFIRQASSQVKQLLY